MLSAGAVDAPRPVVPPSATGLVLQGARLPDGGVFMPKPAQFQLGIRTHTVAKSGVAESLELVGQIVRDPNHSGAIQATQPGVIQGGPGGGLPNLGQRVRKGQVVATLKPVLDAMQRSELLSQLAAIEKDIGVSQKLLERIREQSVTGGINISVQQETYVIEYKGLVARRDVIKSALDAKAEALVAPVDGIVSSSDMFIGKVVQAGDTLFEIVDPAHLWVEALSYDRTFSTPEKQATGVTPQGTRIDLEFMGRAYHLRNQAIPLQFRITRDGGQMLAVGQTVKLYLQGAGRYEGLVLPRESVTRSSGEQAEIWVHHAAEVFSPRSVRVRAVNETSMLVLDGLQPGERVVTAGAQLLSQIR